MKIVVLDGFTLNPGDISWDGLRQLGDLAVYDRTKENEILERIGDAEAIITNKTPITRKTLEAKPSIKYIGVLATGYNVVDTMAAKERSIPVCNVPAYGTTAVSQFVFALLLQICHHVSEHSAAVKEGAWADSLDFCFWRYPLFELAGKTMGIIGLGRIGHSTARIAQALGMGVLAYDEFKKPELESETLKYVCLDELLAQSDVISLHCPLFENTKNIICKKNIEKMKDGVIIINTSRGQLIVEEDLLEALDSGKVYAAAVDVLGKEPPSRDNRLVAHKNCIATPHIAWAPKEARERLMKVAVNNLRMWFAGTQENVVNP